jgi:hypothetical protein
MKGSMMRGFKYQPSRPIGERWRSRQLAEMPIPEKELEQARNSRKVAGRNTKPANPTAPPPKLSGKYSRRETASQAIGDRIGSKTFRAKTQAALFAMLAIAERKSSSNNPVWQESLRTKYDLTTRSGWFVATKKPKEQRH